MFVSGFTIARNVVKADYPLKEAIESILPICDEVIVSVGKSDDNTLEFIKSFKNSKIKIVETEWDDTLRTGGLVLSVETNKAMEHINPKADWCLYIQADECLHQDDYENLKNSMIKASNMENIDGLLFDYVHFYGNYNYVGDSRTWYRHEIRAFKNNRNITSFGDAQGFKKENNKLKVIKANARVHHYGWVKHPKLQLEKLKQARKFWHNDDFLQKEYEKMLEFDFSQIDSLQKYESTHPNVMQDRILKADWHFEHSTKIKKMNLKKTFLYWIEKTLGWRIGEYKNYILIK